MNIENMKNMVVLKDLPSNLIEEAFVVLKDNVKIYKEETVNKENKNENINNNVKNDINKIKDRKYVIKEAEEIISEYVLGLEKRNFYTSNEKNKLEEKCKKLKKSTIFLGIFSLFCIISILLR